MSCFKLRMLHLHKWATESFLTCEGAAFIANNIASMCYQGTGVFSITPSVWAVRSDRGATSSSVPAGASLREPAANE